MATTVNQAFREFMANSVDLDATKVSEARSSRDWLLEQIQKLPANDGTFPILAKGFNIAFGSFARKTKTRPLDDIDLMIGLDGSGVSISEYGWDNVHLSLNNDYAGQLRYYVHDGIFDTNKINSTKITNKFVRGLSSVPQYSSATLKRNGEAATLKLTTKTWNFDIVPCFYVDTGYYLIPNGKGHWKKTNPKIDRDRLQSINQSCGGNVLRVIRVMKYWNQRLYKTKIPSYLLETMISNYYQNEISYQRHGNVSIYVDLEIVNVFKYLKKNIFYYVADPKNISGDINNIGLDDQSSYYTRLSTDLEKSEQARSYEDEGKHRESINKWREVLGNDFPTFY